jgi:hypothetical protein
MVSSSDCVNEARLEWGLDKMMMTLVEPSVIDFGKKKKILGDNVVLPLDLWWVDPASKRN